MKKSVKANYFYNLIYQVLTLIIPIVTTPYLARILGVNGIGISSYTLSLVSYFILFGNIGVSSYGQREIAMNRNDKVKYSTIFWELFWLKFITTSISIIAYVFLIIISPKHNLILLILMINILASIFDISWFFQGLEEYKFISVRNIIIKLVFTISIFLFVKDSSDLVLYVILNSLSLIVSSFSLWFRLSKMITKINKKQLKIFSHLKQTMIYFLPQIATQIYTMLDKTMLGIITGTEIENGYYEQAYKIVTMSLTIIISLNTVMAPRMAYLYKENKMDEIKTRLLKSMKFTLLLGIPMSIGLSLISSDFVGWFFGPGYDKVELLLVVFAPMILIIALSNCLGGQCLTPCGMRSKSAKALFCGAITNFVINLFLIPKFGSLGAVIASVLAELVITILYLFLAKNYINIKDILKSGYKYLICSLIMGLVIFVINIFLPANIISTFAEISCGGIIYLLLLIFIFKDDILWEFINLIKNKFFKRVEYEKKV